MTPITHRYQSKDYFDAIDSTDFQYANSDLFHVSHDKTILETTLLDNRGLKVAEAGGIHNYLAGRSLSSLNHNNSLGGFFFEHVFPYYSTATTPGPINHRFIDRMGHDGQTFQDYAGHSWRSFQAKVLSDHQAHNFTVTDDFYKTLQNEHSSFLELHSNIHPASQELEFGVDNKRLEHNVEEAINAELHPFWFIEEVGATEAFVAGSIVVSSLFMNGSFQGVGTSLLRAGGQQTFVGGSEALIDFVPTFGFGDVTGHALTEGYNLELYGGLSAVYIAAEMLWNGRDFSNRRTCKIIGQRTSIIASKVFISKGIVVIGAKIAGLSTKGATLGTVFGPAGTAVGCALGLAVGFGGCWYFHYDDVRVAEKHEKIFVEAIGKELLTA